MNSKVVMGFLAGAAAGALAGVLLAPDKGSATRKKISGKASDLTQSVKSSFSDFIDSLKETYTGVKAETEELGEKAGEKMNAAKKEIRNALS